MSDKDEFLTAYQKWALMFVPNTYREQLEEGLFLFAKRRNETVSGCHQRINRITRMLKNAPTNTVV
ncbi:hypothetical protein PHMEG_00030977 [Phytophthora megakarya]|uniref:Uncharacterized protein n=1 Tax=Phytophthora megakarya TaxID=4795 RepID=A0A225UZP5_9STRA|nr:hypothetical protein PHMEG_00030977 [Phytophthora megakarya]